MKKLIVVVSLIAIVISCSSRVDNNSFIAELNSLNKADISSGEKALKSFENFAQTSVADSCDKAFLLLENFYNQMAGALSANYDNDKEFQKWKQEGTVEKAPYFVNEVKLLSVNGFRFISEEGYYYVAVNNKFLMNKALPYLSDAFKEYAKLISDKSILEDACLLVSWKELAIQIVAIERYVAKYPTNAYVEALNSDVAFYRSVLLRGIDNSPIFDYNGNLLSEVKETYLFVEKNYSDTETGRIVGDFLRVLEKADYKKDRSVREFMEKL